MDRTQGRTEEEETGGTGIIRLLTPEESKHWEIVQAVNDALREGAGSIERACAAAGVHRSLYYRAMKSRFVQEQRLQQIQAMNEASVTLLEQWWVRIVGNMVQIASSGDSKEAVQAARFVREVLRDLEKQAAQEGDKEEDAAATFLAQFVQAPGARKYKARRTRKTQEGQTTEEIEVTLPDIPRGGGNTIDGSP